MRSCQVWIVASAACASNKGMDRPEWASTPARNSGRYRFLAVLEDHLSPAARPGPIHGMGRAVCGQAHALRGWSRVARARSNASDPNRSTVAHTFFPRPAHVGEDKSARYEHHGDMRRLRSHALVEKRAHVCYLLQSFERDDLHLIRQQGMSGAGRPRLACRMRTFQWAILGCSMVSERCSLVLGAHSILRVLLLHAAHLRKGGAR